MVVFGGVEYALTATCSEPEWFVKRENDWDAIIQTFHVLTPEDKSAAANTSAERELQKRRDYIQERIEMRGEIWGALCPGL